MVIIQAVPRPNASGRFCGELLAPRWLTEPVQRACVNQALLLRKKPATHEHAMPEAEAAWAEAAHGAGAVGSLWPPKQPCSLSEQGAHSQGAQSGSKQAGGRSAKQSK